MKERVQAAAGAAKGSLGMASRVAQLRWRSSLLLLLTWTALCLTYHQYTIANITHKLHWHACTWGHMCMHAPSVLPHACAFMRWWGCVAVPWAQARGPNKLWHVYSCQ